MRLVTWNDLTLRIDGGRLSTIVREQIAESGAPIEDLALDFRDHEVEVRGKVRKFVAIPFRVRLGSPRVDENLLRVPVETLGVFGIPLPRFLAWLAPEDLHEGRVLLDWSGPFVVIDIDGFAPEFVDADVRAVRIVSEGVVVELGEGGVDPPLKAVNSEK